MKIASCNRPAASLFWSTPLESNMVQGDGDALDRELASLKETIGLTNPLTYGHKNDWKTTPVVTRDTMQHESTLAKALPNAFVLTETRNSMKAFQIAAAAAKDPAQPLRPPNMKSSTAESGAKKARSPEDEANNFKLQRRDVPPANAAVKRVPMAKRSHMDGILHGIPRDKTPPKSTVQLTLEYSDEMKTMNRDKDTSFHRKRDAYSEYVEARARFSKMHSVN